MAIRTDCTIPCTEQEKDWGRGVQGKKRGDIRGATSQRPRNESVGGRRVAQGKSL